MTEAAKTEQPAEAPRARIVKTEGRTKTVDLDWPVEFDGKVYDQIIISRLTGAQVEEFLEAVQEHKKGEPRIKPPMLDCPAEVYEALDADDQAKVEEAMTPFLPRRLQMALASAHIASESAPDE